MAFVEHAFIRPGVVEQRLYQEKLVQQALTGNTLIVMPTALGKSFLGMVVAAYVLEKNDGKILFLAPTKPLATQHNANLQRVINLPESSFALLTGAVAAAKRREIWENARVVSATPQTIMNDIKNKKISLVDVSLLIVDECHHTTKKYAYVDLAKWYLEQRKNPLILGLTASPSMEKLNELKKHLAIRHMLSRTEQDADVIPYIQKKEMRLVYVNLPEEFKEIGDILKNFQNELIGKLKEKGLLHRTPRKTDVIELQARMFRQKNFGLALYTTALLKTMHAIELLETQGPSQLVTYFEKMERETTRNAAFVLKKISRAVTLTKMLRARNKEHPKIDALKAVLKEQLAEKPNLRGLVFAHYRNSAQKIADMLEAEGIKTRRFVGQASKAGDIGLKQCEQEEMIREFREGKYNFLTCTSVGEEGLDIPSVDLVVFYEPVPSEIRKIQREGRTGRLHAGKVVVFITKKTKDESYYWSSLRKEKKMKDTLRRIQISSRILSDSQAPKLDIQMPRLDVQAPKLDVRFAPTVKQAKRKRTRRISLVQKTLGEWN